MSKEAGGTLSRMKRRMTSAGMSDMLNKNSIGVISGKRGQSLTSRAMVKRGGAEGLLRLF